jgi:hypothetical protein
VATPKEKIDGRSDASADDFEINRQLTDYIRWHAVQAPPRLKHEATMVRDNHGFLSTLLSLLIVIGLMGTLWILQLFSRSVDRQ